MRHSGRTEEAGWPSFGRQKKDRWCRPGGDGGWSALAAGAWWSDCGMSVVAGRSSPDNPRLLPTGAADLGGRYDPTRDVW